MSLDDQLEHLAGQLGQQLSQLGAQVTTAESCTGGGIAQAITAIAGSSGWFEAGFVTYSNAQKSQMLGVPEALFAHVGAVSEEVVTAMALGAAKRAGAQFSVAVSGVAGPGGGSAEKPVGTVWLAWAVGDAVSCERHVFTGDRQAVRLQTVQRALEGLISRTAQ